MSIQYYHHGRFRVAGGVIPDAITAYCTYGNPKNPCIVFPTCYGGKLDNNGLLGQGYLVGEDKVLDPRKYYIVTFALFSNGESSSPSNTPAPYNGSYFPAVSYEDNIRAQYAVLTKALGVKKVYCALGFSMGGQQAYHWGVVYPNYVEKIVVVVSAAKTSMHNRCILEGPKAALIASKDFEDGHYTSPPQHGIRAFGRVILGWLYGQTWFREQKYGMGGQYPDLQSFIREEGEANWLLNSDANDMLHLLETWRNGDISQVRDNGDYEKALKSIKAKVLLLPSKTDLFFAPEDSEIELSFLRKGTLVPIDTDWGHSLSSWNQSDVDFVHAQIGKFKLAGGILPDAVTAYQTYGDPKNPCIVFPTCYGAKLALGSQDYLVGEGKVLDTKKYYVVTFALFCNGESSSPSNTPAPYNGPYFPFVSYEDNIRAQHAVLTKILGVAKVFCAVGFSMGGQQAYHWPVVFPDFVEKFVGICTSARTSPHNQCFLEGPKAAMLASKDFADGHYTSTPQHGIRAFGRVYCAWAYGQTWFREHKYLMGGEYPDLNTFIRERWEGRNLQYWDANDMIALLATWQKGDISLVRDGGDYEKALKSIKAKALIMPSKTDLYFPSRLMAILMNAQPEDGEIEASHLKDATLYIIPTVWGHVAGGGANPVDVKFISEKIHAFLNS
ncbi:alpha/beta-hydrolase [Gyrodon lividus]|nr:alpha/beta-hydrolase [Gyrodon lividus]